MLKPLSPWLCVSYTRFIYLLHDNMCVWTKWFLLHFKQTNKKKQTLLELMCDEILINVTDTHQNNSIIKLAS